MIPYADLKAWLDLPNDDDQAVVTDLEARVVAHLEGRLELYLGAPKDVTLRLDGTGNDRLWLPQPVADTDPAPATTFEKADGVGGWDAIPAADFELADIDVKTDRNQAVYAVSHGTLVTWPEGRRNVRVATKIGYETGEEPPELRQLVFNAVSALYNDRGHEGFESEKIGDYSYTRGGPRGGGEVQDVIRSLPAAESIISRWRLVKA